MNKKVAIVFMSTVLVGLIVIFFNMVKHDIVSNASQLSKLTFCFTILTFFLSAY
jgi:hypothetical protein